MWAPFLYPSIPSLPKKSLSVAFLRHSDLRSKWYNQLALKKTNNKVWRNFHDTTSSFKFMFILDKVSDCYAHVLIKAL